MFVIRKTEFQSIFLCPFNLLRNATCASIIICVPLVSTDHISMFVLFLLTVVDRYQAHRGKVLLSPPGSATQVHSDLSYAKAACLEFREQCTGITTWNNSYALTRGTVLIKSEETQAVAYVKSGRLNIPTIL